MYFVYILQSRKDNGYYIGYTANLERRLNERNSGKTRSLLHRIPLDIIHFEEFESKRDAKARECQIKSWKGGESFKRLMEGPRRSLRQRLRRVFAPPRF
ncbi:MAG: GIY-YIG nuclease family protein [Calditrichaeota bacterium]|nr:GIY-YIG nuclease family protein [Calditrichota bacterium]